MEDEGLSNILIKDKIKWIKFIELSIWVRKKLINVQKESIS